MDSFLLLNHNGSLPDIIEGFCTGIATALTLMGMYAYNHDSSKFGNYKMDFLQGVLKNSIVYFNNILLAKRK